jgi:hypothetical protein
MPEDYGVQAGLGGEAGLGAKAKLVAGAALWFGNAGHDLGGMLATTGPGDFAAGAAGSWTTHIHYSLK